MRLSENNVAYKQTLMSAARAAIAAVTFEDNRDTVREARARGDIAPR
jgi:hypothetical protein